MISTSRQSASRAIVPTIREGLGHARSAQTGLAGFQDHSAHRLYFLSPLMGSLEPPYIQRPMRTASPWEYSSLQLVLTRRVSAYSKRPVETSSNRSKHRRSRFTNSLVLHEYENPNRLLGFRLSMVHEPSLSCNPLTKCGYSASSSDGKTRRFDLPGPIPKAARSSSTSRAELIWIIPYLLLRSIYSLPSNMPLTFSRTSESDEVNVILLPSLRMEPSPYNSPNSHSFPAVSGANAQPDGTLAPTSQRALTANLRSLAMPTLAITSNTVEIGMPRAADTCLPDNPPPYRRTIASTLVCMAPHVRQSSSVPPTRGSQFQAWMSGLGLTVQPEVAINGGLPGRDGSWSPAWLPQLECTVECGNNTRRKRIPPPPEGDGPLR